MALNRLPHLPPGFDIRRLKTAAEYHAAEELQVVTWAMTDRVEATPIHVLVTAQKNGGLVLGAFAPDGTLAAFLFGFLGTTADGTLKHVSHQLGVLPQYRGLSLGYLLKRAQRGEVRRQGLDLVTWTYDPLETVNAHLNLTQLGAVNTVYLRSVYGEMRDSLNRGLPSDRFQVDWWIRSQWVHERLSLAHPLSLSDAVARLPVVNQVTWQAGDGGPIVAPVGLDGSFTASDVLLQVPYHFQAVKRADLDLAYTWRMHSREAFEALFAQGYAAVDMLRGDLEGRPVAYYRFIRPDTPPPWRVREHAPIETIPDLPTALRQFAQLYHQSLFWKAHEVLEAPWAVAEGEDKALLQGLIRTAAAFHKLTAHGNPTGAARHLAWV
ncbi:MAG: DUF309 domain-containing protein, partial [Anaerolineae bacterium]|nr:DUF309 domain-containing protein [Anaerolineae bacterium]